MPRTYTVTEREYMARLAARNATDEEQDPEEGVEIPMPADERMRRKRIREKADTAMRDLLVADAAGVIDFGELHNGHNVGMALGLTVNDGVEEAFWMYIGDPPEEVNIQ